MRFYTEEHRFYCGVDLHARSLYVCVLDEKGHVVLHRNLPASEYAFLSTIEAGARQAGRRWRLESLHGAAFDHPVLEAFPEGDYLKFAIGRID